MVQDRRASVIPQELSIERTNPRQGNLSDQQATNVVDGVGYDDRHDPGGHL